MKNKKQLELIKKNHRVEIRFQDDEFKKLKEESDETGKNIQTIIKNYLENKKNIRPLMGVEEAKSIVTELKRIGNNFNQIARHLNSGYRKNWHDSFERCAEDLEKLRSQVQKNVAS